MSGEMLGEQENAIASDESTDTTTKRYSRALVCYRDTDRAEAVCGECGRPVCGPIMDASLGGLASSIFGDHGHGRQFHDATFHHYRSGLQRVVLTVGLFGVALLFSTILPDLVPSITSSVFSSPIGLGSAIVQSSVILGVAALTTLRYQTGEHSTSLRIRVRSTADRVFCDRCFEDRLVQVVLTYALNVAAIVVVLLGLRGIVVSGSALPLRLVAVGLALGMLRDDVVAYVMERLETEASGDDAAFPGGPDTGSSADELLMETESPSDGQTTDD